MGSWQVRARIPESSAWSVDPEKRISRVRTLPYGPSLSGPRAPGMAPAGGAKGLSGLQIETVTLHAAPADTPSRPSPRKVDWDFLRTRVDRRRQKTLE